MGQGRSIRVATTLPAIHVRHAGEPADTVLSQALEAIFRYKRVFLLVFGLGIALTLLYIFGSHKKYQSNMSLLVENERKQEVISADSSNEGAAPEVTEEDLYSQVELLGSQDVLDEVVDPNWRKVPLTAHSQAAEQKHEVEVAALRGRLVMAPVRKSHVIDVSFTAKSPQIATETLDRLLAVYLAHEKAVSSPAGASTFFNGEANRYEAQWQSAQQELADFQQQHGMVSAATRETELGTAIAEALTLQRAAQAEVAEVGKRLSAEQRLLASTGKREETSQTLTPSTGTIDQSSGQLVQLELRRSQLLTEYLPTDRIVQQVDSQIAAAKDEVSKAETMHSSSVTTGINPTWQTLDEQLEEDKAHYNAAAARDTAITGQISDLQSQMQQAEQDSVHFNVLAQNVATLATNYQLYVGKRDAAAISQAMDAHGLINIGVLQSPSFSLGAVRPRPRLDGLMGFMASFLLACFAVYIAEYGRRTVASSTELKEITHHPVLAAVSLGQLGKVQTLSGTGF